MIYFKNRLKLRAGSLGLAGLIFAINSCTYDVLPEPDDCSNAPAISLVSAEDANCGQANGSITVSVSGGTGVYSFSRDGNTFQDESAFSGLSAGSYTITVKDESSCTSTLQTSIKNLDGLNITVQATDAGCGTANGSVNINTEGGELPYQFKINGGNFQTNPVFTGLINGTHTVVAKDASGCEITQEVTITSGISFESIQSIVQSNCAISTCHGGNISPDFRKADNILAKASQIKARTSGKTMPPPSSGRSLTADEIEEIACWAADGGLKN